MLRANCWLAVARADSSELITATEDGRCQRWPLDVRHAAQRLARGELTLRERELYRIGTADERRERQEQRLRATPTPRNLARLGESLLERGELHEAIDAYRRGCEMAPLPPFDRHRYVCLLELLARRRALVGRPEAERVADTALATRIVGEATRCGVTPDELLAIPGLGALVELPPGGRMSPR